MNSRGRAETEKLRQNLEGQLDRLVQQLEDLESCRDELDESEYSETKNDTLEQLKELNDSLSKMMSGDMTLVDQLSAMQLATQAAISEAFRTPAVIRMFARREPELLRQRLSEIERDVKLGKGSSSLESEKVEVLNALRQLGEKLSTEELRLVQERCGTRSEHPGFVQVATENSIGQEALALAGKEARSVQSTK
ncbi:hypothetical protein ONE63_009791 [Megalurothrips usitatus]|uniref:Beta-catenin-interacting ICAT domain-containing protein n=1 Tax=Megalurothrips usitatus TaxID=439358 RepID=A0AAV7XMP4_9NEOP|nr:hypothetical protein ONE63_009791 [Megalurothrips usitatus]